MEEVDKQKWREMVENGGRTREQWYELGDIEIGYWMGDRINFKGWG